MNRCAAFNDPTNWKFDSNGAKKKAVEENTEDESTSMTLRAEQLGRKLYRAFRDAVALYDSGVQ